MFLILPLFLLHLPDPQHGYPHGYCQRILSDLLGLWLLGLLMLSEIMEIDIMAMFARS